VRGPISSKVPGFLLVLGSIATILVPVWVSFERPLSSVEMTLVQGAGLALGLWGSHLFGKLSAKESARELVEVHARSAFRRLIALYSALGRMAQTVARAQSRPGRKQVDSGHLEVLQEQIVQQIDLASDAMEDWRDIVPEEVAVVEEQMHRRLGNGEVEDG
jgi:hypothetical protein